MNEAAVLAGALAVALAAVRLGEKALSSAWYLYRARNGHAPHEGDAAVAELKRVNEKLGTLVTNGQKHFDAVLETRQIARSNAGKLDEIGRDVAVVKDRRPRR